MANNVIVDIITSAVLKTLRSPNVPQVSNSEAPAVTREIVKDLAPQIEFKTNNEPWFQSYVTLGSLGTVITSIGFIISDLSNGGGIDTATMGQSIAVILGAAVALYGRWIAKKPIGE